MVWWIRHRRTVASVAVILLVLSTIFTILKSQPYAVQAAFEPMVPAPEANDRLGIAFISSAEVAERFNGVPSYRYDRATAVGASWNRWPFYWHYIELSDGNSNYAWQDSAVNSDLARGLKINGILVGTPAWASSVSAAAQGEFAHPKVGEGPRLMGPPDFNSAAPSDPTVAGSPVIAPPRNLYAGVFSDNSDTPGPGKTINPNNYWARFVYNTVSRYRGKVAAWEMWNEPDLIFNGQPAYWSGSVEEYRRLLKVGYIAAKFADPNVTVLMGGMAYWSNPSFFTDLLGRIKSDGSAAANNYYFDATAWHWYSRASQMYDMVINTRNLLASHGLGHKPIWVNETGVPIWNDPAKPPFGGSNQPYFASATQDEAASFVIQSIAYGLAAGVQRIMHFQHYDDENAETFGLVRNDNSTRPSLAAFQVASQYLRDYSDAQKATDGTVEKIVFSSYSQGKKVTVLWNKSPVTRNYIVDAMPGSTQAYLVDKSGYITNLGLTGSYNIYLPGATDNNGENNQDYIIGGSPYLLVQHFPPFHHQLRLPLLHKNASGFP